ncbi:AAA family ATPase [Sphingobium yanoikuyae]|uniref:AAA family ATPase n=1 Tax=Sphingobium yanoikuyae TaxID=13690 RepID=A0A430BWW6_SPHYA|nr:AAA family ATPase [Sphingobium yanoikuyae]RSU57219.1 hypothetical protein DAH51_10425 [Sphingobium yanoikuyae]
MIHVDTLPVDVADMIDWANGFKAMHGLSWEKFGELVDIKAGTLQPFCKGNYAGRNEDLARKIFKFKQAEESRTQHQAGIPVEPEFFECPTTLRVRAILAEAASGNMTAGGLGPGMCKTKTAQEFLGRVSPAWMITLDELTYDVGPVVRLVENAIGLKSNKNWASRVSADIIDFLRKKRALLIVDEANHASRKTLEQFRRWHDATGVGICLLGNEELITRLETGKERDAFGRLNSRISERLVQNMLEEDDIACFCDAWNIFNPGIRALLMDVALRPGSGGLRECRQIITKASVIATQDGGSLELAHVRWAYERRAIRIIR